MYFLLFSVAAVVPYFLPQSTEASRDLCEKLKNPDFNTTKIVSNKTFNNNLPTGNFWEDKKIISQSGN